MEDNKEITKTAWKKEQKKLEMEKRKREKQMAADKQVSEQQQKRIEEAKNIIIDLDPSLPEAKDVKIRDCSKLIDQRVAIKAFVHRLRSQGIQNSSHIRAEAKILKK